MRAILPPTRGQGLQGYAPLTTTTGFNFQWDEINGNGATWFKNDHIELEVPLELQYRTLYTYMTGVINVAGNGADATSEIQFYNQSFLIGKLPLHFMINHTIGKDSFPLSEPCFADNGNGSQQVNNLMLTLQNPTGAESAQVFVAPFYLGRVDMSRIVVPRPLLINMSTVRIWLGILST